MAYIPDVTVSAFHLVSAATTNATVIKSSAGCLRGWCIHNKSAGTLRVVLHNTASTPTAGSGVYWVVKIPAGATANSDFCLHFSTGIAITTVSGDTDATTTAVALNDLDINIAYS